MKIWLLAAMVAVGMVRPAAAAWDMDTSNGTGEALEVFQMPISVIGVTTLVSSSSTATITSVQVSATVYWFQVFVVRNLATGSAIDSTTGFLVLAMSGTWTGGAAHDGITMWLNGARGVPFGLYGAGRIGADDELLRVGEYSEGMTGMPIRIVFPTFHVLTPQTAQAGLNGATVVIRYGMTPYGVNPALRKNAGSADARTYGGRGPGGGPAVLASAGC